jgi:hypothetical protein
MFNRLFLVIGFLFLSFSSVLAQLQSPEQFLGYKPGAKFTQHWQLVNYFRHAAAAAPSIMKLQQYGLTNEGRPLIAAFISSQANIANIESIRSNNLRLAGVEQGTEAASVSSPVVVWLSYNVHGNEASSSEASLMTLYALLNPDEKTRQWLQNTVVVIDPCLNPDGRDRYVNWFLSMVGSTPNPSQDAREHYEPWPGGRVNHYNFDLNRDWAWQSQLETRQRVALYNQWLPQVHVDFHEQYINNPYYFAPAAQPYHEVITPWQRQFQETIGRNHARYFDQQGWLYFTKEYFDLLYPSYGDTYPIYNGAIGMTYEQAGHSFAGAAVTIETGDTLTLYDRALHHYTTGMSTVEVASKNASKLLSEFQRYFQQASTGSTWEYKSYVIKHSARDEQRLGALRAMLTGNGIRFMSGRPGNYRGFNYETGKEENFSVGEKDLVIPGAQPKGALVKVLFEPQTQVVDTFTYDITAWAMPYAYGVKAFATRTSIPTTGNVAMEFTTNNAPAQAPYGYVIPWNGMQSVQLVSALLQKGIRLRFSEQPFEIGGTQFDRGSIIVLKTSNQYVPNLWEDVRALANQHKVSIHLVGSGFVDKGSDFGSGRIQFLKTPRVAMLTGEGVNPNAAGEVWHYFDQVIKYPVTLINQNSFSQISWSKYDVLILPNGSYRFMNDKALVDQLRSWVQGGGRLIALESAVTQLSKQDWSIKSKKSEESDNKNIYESLKRYENRERDFLPNSTPGSIFRVELDRTHPLAFGFSDHYYTLKQDDQIYEFIQEGGWNVGVLRSNNQVSGFVGRKLRARLTDGMLFGVQDVGNGSITYLTDNVLFRSFWENGKLMFSNAVFLVGQ